jgi:hypothetical protein
MHSTEKKKGNKLKKTVSTAEVSKAVSQDKITNAPLLAEIHKPAMESIKMSYEFYKHEVSAIIAQFGKMGGLGFTANNKFAIYCTGDDGMVLFLKVEAVGCIE